MTYGISIIIIVLLGVTNMLNLDDKKLVELKIKKYHMDIVSTINRAIKNKKQEIFIDMAPGNGKMQVIKKWINSLEYEKDILIVVDRDVLIVQYDEYFSSYDNITVCNYKDIINYNNVSYVIFNNSEFLKENEYINIKEIFSNSIIIFFLDLVKSIMTLNNWICDKKIDYRFKTDDIIDNCYLGDEANNLISRLNNIEPGKNECADKKYEKLCTDIIMYLFADEFGKIYKNSHTKDNMFKMDLICTLKGKNDFFKILVEHYNTRLLVFEFKNYEDEISQNLIYTTEKYLYNASLRNVAIIISRKGFSNNAYRASVGTLTENNKLIMDLTDNDLINMIKMKVLGENIFDYMNNLLFDYLVSISK